MAEQLYNQSINEFTDWVTGIDNVTKEDITKGLKVSGGKIRELLLNKLLRPIYLVLNTQLGKYLIFSSETAYELYLQGGHDDLLLGEFEGPSAYSIKITLVDSQKLQNIKKVNEGGSCVLDFNWLCTDLNDVVQQTSVNVTTVITNSKGVLTGAFVSDYSADTTSTSIDVYSYLLEGRNLVTITIQSNEFGAKSVASYTLFLVKLNISVTEESFKWYNAVSLDLDYLYLRLFYSASIAESSELHFYLDGKEVYTDTISMDYDYNVPLKSILTDKKNKEGLHKLVIYALNTNNNSTIYSNIISINFTVAVTDTSSELVTNTMLNNYYSFEDSVALLSIINGNYNFNLTLYSTFEFNWGLWRYDNTSTYTIKFYLKPIDKSEKILLNSFDKVLVNTKGTVLKYQFVEPLQGLLVYNIGRDTTDYVIGNITVSKFPYSLRETTGYRFKLSAFNKINGIDNTWLPDYGDANVVFSPSVNFNDNNGWYDNSFRVQGANNYVTINNFPLGERGTKQFTVEIEFYTEFVDKDTDLLADLFGCVKIYPTSASIVNYDGTPIITTNFKANEKVKIAFSRYSNTASDNKYKGLVTITTNGVLERAEIYDANLSLPSNNTVKIGGGNSGIRFYMLRYYANPIYWKGCYDNWLFDSDNKLENYQKNDVANSVGDILTSKCEKKLDVIKLIGNLGDILTSTEKVHSTIDKLERVCPYDSSKNFTIYNCLVRKHGQSTLTYPIPSLKFWSNKRYDESVLPPELEASDTKWAKNRYQMKDNAIPANKWVLLANFADSSGTHNGAILRLMQNTWYNASFTEGVKLEFKLRTPPLLFASNNTITINKLSASDPDYYEYEVGINGEPPINLIAKGYNSEGKLWKDYNPNTPFPYTIRTATDSFPCVIFYLPTINSDPKFLGQYVFMDDKKSDYIYGERSIYNVPTDPFCLTNQHKKDDTKANRLWNNKNVLRIEILSMDEAVVDYQLECSEHYLDSHNQLTYEFIYPDPDDILEEEYDTKFKPFVDFLHWVVSTKNDQAKFEAEATKHLDIYKMAAYYIYCMIFGLVDSIDRNALIKTYDGKHFWYEIWDADIACGNKNTGGIKWAPGTDRLTAGAGTTGESAGAFSGKNSVLWNNLEKWDYWYNEILPTVALALYKAGLTYDNVISMFDDEYANKWCEYIYDKSGEYKYIEAGSDSNSVNRSSYLAWLQGARTTHRHWWIKTSMDYWYSKWGVGSFRDYNFYITTYSSPITSPKIISIIPSLKSYFGWTLQSGGAVHDLIEGTPNVQIDFDVKSINLSPKIPFFIYGALNIKSLDIHNISGALDGIEFKNSYNQEDKVSLLESLNIGTNRSLISDTDNKYNGWYKLDSINDIECNLKNFDILTNLQSFDATGLHNLKSITFSSKLKNLKLIAVGFNSISCNGNEFETLELPNKYTETNIDSEGISTNTVTYLGGLSLNNCSWKSISFWNTEKSTNGETIIVPDADIESGESTTKIIYPGYTKLADKLLIPNLYLTGTTCNSEGAKELFLQWLHSIENGKIANLVITSDNLLLDNVNWEDITYADVIEIGKYYNKNNPNIHGKITLLSTETISIALLSELTNLFGDNVFTLNSGGLVIDYPRDTSIITITGNNCSYDSTNNRYEFTEKGTVSLRLNFTKFALREEVSQSWRVQLYDNVTGILLLNDVAYPNQTALSNKPNVKVVATLDTISDKWIYTLNITESKNDPNLGDYKLRVITENTGYISYVDLLVHPVSYEGNSISIKNSTDVRNLTNKYVYQSLNSKGTFYIDRGTSTATFLKCAWVVTKNDVRLDSGFSDVFTSDSLTDENTTKEEFTLTIKNNILLPENEVSYKLICNITYLGGTDTVSWNLGVMDDPIIVNKSSSSKLIKSIKGLGIQSEDGIYYASDVKNAPSTTLYLSGLEFANDLRAANSTDDNYISIFKYTTGINEVYTNGSNIIYKNDIDALFALSNITNCINLSYCMAGDFDTLEIKDRTFTGNKPLGLPKGLTNLIISNIKLAARDIIINGGKNITIKNINDCRIVWLDITVPIKNYTIEDCSNLDFGAYLKATNNKDSLETITIKNYTYGDYNKDINHYWLNYQSKATIDASNIKGTLTDIYQDFYKTLYDKSKPLYDIMEFTDYFVVPYNIQLALNDHFRSKNLYNYYYNAVMTTTKTKGSATSNTTISFKAVNNNEISTLIVDAYKNHDEYETINLLSSNYLGMYHTIDLSAYDTDIVINNYDNGYPKIIKVRAPEKIIYTHTNSCQINVTNTGRLRELKLNNVSNGFSLLCACNVDNIVSAEVNCNEVITSNISAALNTWYLNKSKLTLSGTVTSTSTSLSTAKRVLLEKTFPNVTFRLGPDSLEFSDKYAKEFVALGNAGKKSGENLTLEAYKEAGTYVGDWNEKTLSQLKMYDLSYYTYNFSNKNKDTLSFAEETINGYDVIKKITNFPEAGYISWDTSCPRFLFSSTSLKSIAINLYLEVSNSSSWSTCPAWFVLYVVARYFWKYNEVPGMNKICTIWSGELWAELKILSFKLLLIPDTKVSGGASRIVVDSKSDLSSYNCYIFSTAVIPDFITMDAKFQELYAAGNTTIDTMISALINQKINIDGTEHPLMVKFSEYKTNGTLPYAG